MRVSLSVLFLATLFPVFAADPYTAQVVHIVDGDTLTVARQGHLTKSRLFGIDCPESRQEAGPEATRFTKDLALDRSVIVIPHDIDRYGRTVAEIVLPDGRALNKEIVRAGYAWWYWEYDRSDSDMQKLEADARDNRMGLWFGSNPIAPWDWRKTLRSKHSRDSARSERRSEPRTRRE
jgi:endonuclease YncB( thermonuclease family)